MLHRSMLCLLGVPLLGACAQVASPSPAATGAQTVPLAIVSPVTEQPVRVIVRFRVAVAYRDPAFVQDLAQQIQAGLSYVSSVSESTHVYLLAPLPGQPAADAIARLMRLPTVQWVERDTIVHPS